MRVHHETDRLVRIHLLHFCNVGESACLVLSGFEHHDVIAELDDQGVIAAVSGRKSPEAVAELLRHNNQSGSGTSALCATSTTTSRRTPCCGGSTASGCGSTASGRGSGAGNRRSATCALTTTCTTTATCGRCARAAWGSATTTLRLWRQCGEIGRIGFCSRNIDFKVRPSATRLHDLRWSHHPA